ncbi:MAG TPA: efflux transporter outer membrane subunit [Gallionellaceae bacterium]|nr:efflux transporter outer membrane subunit [Gallionellaceae bacterium]
MYKPTLTTRRLAAPVRSMLAAAASAALLAACAAGPDYERPKSDLPANWGPAASAAQPSGAPAAAQAASAPVAAALPVKTTGQAGERWWALFSDPVLDRLEDEAHAHNATAQAAVANVLLARAQLGLADADRYPTVTANARQTRTKMSSIGTFPFPPTFNTTRNLTHLSVDASYELDLWGKYRRASESAQAALFAAESTRDAAFLSLSAQVAQQYFALLSYDEQETVLKRALAGRQEMISLDRKKVEVGAMSDYDLHQAEADEADIRSQLIALAEARDKQEAAFAVLLGRSPREIMSGKAARGTPVLREVWVPEGLPSDLMLRRPDVHAAEMHLVAMNAQIGVARAQYYPSVTLTGYLGQEASPFSQLFTGPARIFQFGAALTQPITDLIFGRATYRVDVAQANRDAALAQYREAVANAFADVRSALTEQSAARQILAAQSARSDALAKAYRQAEARYKVGMSSRLEVLDVEKNYLLADLNRVDAQRAQRSAIADLFKAMGGGWRAQPAEAAPAGTPAPGTAQAQ